MSKLFLTSCSLTLVAMAISFGMLSPVDAAKPPKPAQMNCSIDVLYEFRAQNGTLLNTEVYTHTFTVQEGVAYVDDFSTPTRFKVFTANLEKVGNEMIVRVNWFSDVGVFDSIDFTTSMKLVNGQKTAVVSADLTHSSTPGHAMTSYTLTGSRK